MKYYTVKELQRELQKAGIDWSEVWIRTLISEGKITSTKAFNSRIVSEKELRRIKHVSC